MHDGPQPDEFVERVVSDPGSPPRVTVVEGFVGRSALDGHVRVYANAALTSWVDVPADAVRHSQRMTDSPLGGSTLWVDFEARLEAGGAGDDGPERSAADFLRGAIGTRLAGHTLSSAADDEARLSTYYPECPPSVYPACRVA